MQVVADRQCHVLKTLTLAVSEVNDCSDVCVGQELQVLELLAPTLETKPRGRRTSPGNLYIQCTCVNDMHKQHV